MNYVRPASQANAHNLERCIETLKTARTQCRAADCPALQKKIHSAIKSAEGARRHLDRRIRHTNTVAHGND
jgi:hypothetical protein